MRRAVKSPLALTIALAVVLLVGISVWLLTDPKTTRADALRTGGLAGGAIVALYALWLNDRRRKVEEGRQEIERQRHDLESRRAERDLERVADERFAKAVELLGDDADQVRVGALHALAGLARNRPSYRQTVLDVLCSYLRRPFVSEETPEAAREGVVRKTAQRLIADLLPAREDREAATYDLDLTAASLDHFDLSGRRIGELTLREAELHSTTRFHELRVEGPLWMTKATVHGHLRLHDSTFGRGWFSGTKFLATANFEHGEFTGPVTFRGAEFSKEALFEGTTFGESLSLHRTKFDDYVDLRITAIPSSLELYQTLVRPDREHELPDGLELQRQPNGDVRIVAARPA
ncbi:pentapeptide repeat-containing protein [Amycolatopsis magusensis]|uniref:pentapeptide repeat-containing protein n=1 Tax=Amycolatopsis magusensis TaxID=882444 RepID=UPI0024A89471|nr:pentapeptide repeat-containing protein [Amycolatopsis magusensis]MDI5979573.1 pentapeptide repeat-containing protein [Amycolatopsis magusensis]